MAVTVIVPTRHEGDNVAVLARRVSAAFEDTGIAWSLLFVDDSDDDTPSRILLLADQGLPVRLHHRPRGLRPGGLGGAVTAGFEVADGDVVVVMDGDLQHPPEVLPDLVRPVIERRCDLTAGTRYVKGGSSSGLATPLRQVVSRACRVLVRVLFPRTRVLTDPLGGLFAVRRDVVTSTPLECKGFKILLEILVAAPWNRAEEIPYAFGTRSAGRSKASLAEGRRFLMHVGALIRNSLLRRYGRTPSGPAMARPTATDLDLSIVIPAFNEENRLPTTLSHLLQVLAAMPLRSEVLIVDNGSVDRTADLVRALPAGPVSVKLLSCARRGKGAAVRRGVLAARGAIIGFCDADMATDLSALQAVLEALEPGVAAAIGSRRVLGAELVEPHGPVRRAGSWLFRRLAGQVVPGVRDTQCGFKFFRADVARLHFNALRCEGFAFDVEVLRRLCLSGEQIVEVPVQWSNMEGSTFRPLRDGARIVGELREVRRNVRPAVLAA